jgi:hypothetical protein
MKEKLNKGGCMDKSTMEEVHRVIDEQLKAARDAFHDNGELLYAATTVLLNVKDTLERLELDYVAKMANDFPADFDFMGNLAVGDELKFIENMSRAFRESAKEAEKKEIP